MVRIAAKYRSTFLRLANFTAFLGLGIARLDAQVEVKPFDPLYPEIHRQFELSMAEHRQRPLSCRVEPVQPRLGYSFRFFSGFYATFPARQFDRGRNRVAAAFRVTSTLTGDVHYFVHAFAMPPIPEFPGNIRLDAGGGFYIGAGTYKIDWVMADQKNRVCVHSWTVHTPRTKFSLLIPPGSVRPLGLEAWAGFKEEKKTKDGRLTIFLSAMPVYRRRSLSHLPSYDLAILLSSLTTLLDSTKYSHARVVAFDLLSKRILFEQDDFDPAGYHQLHEKLESASYGTIDYQTLARGMTDRKLLEQMLKKEASRPNKSDAVIFLGAEGY
ncbi:MAG TPA: hypothetical protein VGL53_23390, partial [Bryobacteraceae bacterium]